MSIVVEVEEVESKGLFRRATSHRERPRDFDAARVKTPVQTRIDTGLWTNNEKVQTKP
jgi:hypothetical protein